MNITLKMIRHNLLWIALFVLTLFVILFAHYCSDDWKYCAFVINFSYDGIESGLNPVGNKFDATEIKERSVIQTAAEAVGRAVSEENIERIQAALNIRSDVSPETFDSVVDYESVFGPDEIEKKSNVRVSSYFPSQYTVRFHYANAGFATRAEGERFLAEVFSAYENLFYRKYGYNSALRQSLDLMDYSEYDYIYAVEIAQNRLLSLRRYLSALSLQDNTRFVSAKTGRSFSDLVETTDSLLSEDFDWITSYIISNNITKDKRELIDYYRYKIEDLERDIIRLQSRLDTLSGLIESYVKTNAIFIGVTDTRENAEGSTSSYEFSRQSEQYDALIGEKVSCETAISQDRERIDMYWQRMERLQSGVSTGSANAVETRLEAVGEKTNQLAIVSGETADEFFRTVWLKRAVQRLDADGVLSRATKDLLKRALPDVVIVWGLLCSLFFFCAIRAKRSQKYADAEPPELQNGEGKLEDTALRVADEDEMVSFSTAEKE